MEIITLILIVAGIAYYIYTQDNDDNKPFLT